MLQIDKIAAAVRCALSLAGLALPPLVHANEAQTPPSQSQPPASTQLSTVQVNGQGSQAGYGMAPDFQKKSVNLGPLGKVKLLDTPYSISVIPQDILVNQQASDPTELLRYLPSTQLEQRSGAALGRPQSRGFEGEMVSNSRMDGLNFLDSTANAAEELEQISVLNGLAGALYGPQVPGGIFEYTRKAPTDTPLNRLSFGYGDDSVLTEHGDFGGRLGQDGWFGYRLNVLHADGDGPYKDSHLKRNLLSGNFDFHIDEHTLLQLDATSNHFSQRGWPGIFTYDSGKNTELPSARSAEHTGYGQPYGGMDLDSKTQLAKLSHDFNDDWHLSIGFLHELAQRYLPVISNNFTDNAGHYAVTLGQNSISQFAIDSDMAYLNGKVDTGSWEHELSFGTNGYVERRAFGHNPTSVNLGNGSFFDPGFLPEQPWGSDPGFQHQPIQTRNTQQSLIAGDTVHFNQQWAVMGIVSSSYLSSRNFARSGAQTSDYQVRGAISPTASIIYTPTSRDTVYATYARSEQPGDTAPSNALNAGDTLAPYRSSQYELGYKTELDGLSLGAALFHMARPFALVGDDGFYAVHGQQRNNGIELSAAGQLAPGLMVLGGATWLDPLLEHTRNLATDDKQVVGVPRFQTSALLDYTLPVHVQGLNAWALTLGVHHTGRRAATITNNSYAAAYTTLDLGTRLSFNAAGHPLILRLQLDNATNAHYWASLYPGSVNGGTASDTAGLGIPRTLQASVELDL